MNASLFHHGSDSTAAQPIGNCPNCGGIRYATLTHHCVTTVLHGQAQIGSNTGPCECGHGYFFHPHSDSGRRCNHKFCICPGLKEARGV